MSPPSPRPSYSVRPALERSAAKSWRCRATERRQTPIQSIESIVAIVVTGALPSGGSPCPSPRQISTQRSPTGVARPSSSALPGRAAPRCSPAASSALVDAGVPGEHVAILAGGPATRTRLRDRIETLLDRPYEELPVHTWEELAEKLLRDYSLEAGLDPFFEVVGPADRLAVLLERLDELPLRRHEIRGNPAGLLARLLERIDALKAEGIGSAELRDHARAAERGAGRVGPSARRPCASSSSRTCSSATTRSCSSAAAIDEPELILELGRLLSRRPDVSLAIGDRFAELMVDELEDAGAARSALLPLLAPHEQVLAACDPAQGLGAFRAWGEAAAQRFRATYPTAGEFTLDRSIRGAGAPSPSPADATRRWRRWLPRATPAVRRGPWPRDAESGEEAQPAEDFDPPTPPVRLWRCANERAQAQAVAREIEHLLAAGECQPEAVCVVTGPAGREGRLVAAALEERNVPFRCEWLGRLLPPARGPRRDRLAARPRRSRRLLGRRPRADAAARRAALGRSRALHDDRPPPQARHDLRRRGRAREPAAATALARSDPRLPEALPRRREGARPAQPRRLRPAVDRAGRLPAARPLRGEPGDRRAARQPRPPRRARGFVDAAAPGRFLARVHPLPERRRRGRPALQPGRSTRRRAARCCSPSRRSSRGWSSSASTCSASRAAPTAAGRSAAPGSTRACSPSRGRRRPWRSAMRCDRAAPTWRSPVPPARSSSPSRSRRGPAPAARRRSTRRCGRSAPTRSATRRSSSARPRACTRPTGWSATRCWRPRGGRGPRSARCVSTRPRTSTAPSPASSSCSSSRP